MSKPLNYPPRSGVLAHLVLDDAAAALDFCKTAFGYAWSIGQPLRPDMTRGDMIAAMKAL